MGTIDTNTQTENSPENPPLRHCHLTSGDLTVHPRHMSHLPVYPRYGPERMTEVDITSLDLDGNTLDGVPVQSLPPGHCLTAFILSTSRREQVI
jgi:hypothetical protein